MAKGWGDMLTTAGIDQQRASDYMRLAGFVEVSPTFQNVGETSPTLADAGIDKRPRKVDADNAPDRSVAVSRRRGA
ncbi:MAG: hypothetical protein NT062_37860 [Proteobacteria bacterium]|nr:hypothetical protein [Pseudomonadota bacterium]